MELAVKQRNIGKKTESKRIRREGGIPAIVYSRGNEGENIIVQKSEYQKILNSIEPGTLSSKIITLKHDKRKSRAILKDIQYEVTTYEVLHLDFEELHDDVLVTMKIPLRFTSVNDCAGIKQGGFLRQVISYVRVRALPKDLPSMFEIDIKDLGLGEMKKVGEIKFPKGVQPLTPVTEVAVVISRRQ